MGEYVLAQEVLRVAIADEEAEGVGAAIWREGG